MSGGHSLAGQMRPSAGDPLGALVLLHGRGADELDLLPLLDLLDPEQRLLGVTPRAPLALPPGGAHWYITRELGYPDPATFLSSYERAAAWLDELARTTGIAAQRIVIGGFSQGAVMSYALALGRGRPRPAGLIALSGFVPTVEGFELDLDPPLPLVAIGHGTLDAVIGVEFGRAAAALLREAGADLRYQESALPHAIDPSFLRSLRPWIEQAVSAEPSVAP